MKSPNFVAIMAILTEMARRLNENISKVELKPLKPFGTDSEMVGEFSKT